jgi:hypothetical protein
MVECAQTVAGRVRKVVGREQTVVGREKKWWAASKQWGPRANSGGARCNSGPKRAPVSNTVRLVPKGTSVDDSSAAATKLSISRTVNAFFANKNMSRRTCACCNELFSPSKMKSVKSSGFSDVSEIEPALANVPLAKAGVVSNPSDTSGPCLVRVMTSFLLNLFAVLFDSVVNLNSVLFDSVVNLNSHLQSTRIAGFLRLYLWTFSN